MADSSRATMAQLPQAWTGRTHEKEREMYATPLNSQEWHHAIVGENSVQKIVADIQAENNAWFRPLLDATAPGETLLELGCGTGVYSGILAKNGRRTTLLDYSEKSVEFCKTVFAEANLAGDFVQADVFKPFPFADNSFDCVWSSGLLEHYTDEQILYILKESARVSRKQVISLVPNAKSMFYRIGKWYQETHGIWPWGREDPKHSLKRLFAQAGVVVESEFTIDVKGAIYFMNPVQPAVFRRAIKLIARALPISWWNALNQGFLLVTIGTKAGPGGAN